MKYITDLGKAVRKTLGVSFIVCALTACGGGGGDSYTSVGGGVKNPDTNSESIGKYNGTGGGKGPVVNSEAMGIYRGTTIQEQTAVGLVDKNNKIWFLYTPPYTNMVNGFIAGNLIISGNKVTSTNGKDYHLESSSIYNTIINGTVETKKSLTGTITYQPSNQVTFNTVYDAALNNTKADLATIAGAYIGQSAIVQGVENANLTINNTGVIAGKGQSGCVFSGKATAEINASYYTISLVFSGSPCYMAGQEVNGVAYFDPTNKSIYAIAENSSRQNAVLFLGTKQ